MPVEFLNPDVLIKEIQDYCPYCERITLSTLLGIYEKIDVINLGLSGFGKTRSSADLLRMLNHPFYLLRGNTTPRAFFDLVEEASKFDTVVIDESSNLLRNPRNLNTLLSMFDKVPIVWASKGRKEVIEFNSNVILNTNSLPKSEDFEAIRTRCVVNSIDIMPHEMQRVTDEKMKPYDPNMELWQSIYMRLLGSDDFPTSINSYAENFGLCMKLNSIILDRNPRTFQKTVKISKFSHVLTGDLSLFPKFFDFDLQKACKLGCLKREDLIRLIVEKYKVAEKTANNYISVWKR